MIGWLALLACEQGTSTAPDWVDLVAQPCAVDSVGRVECWSEDAPVAGLSWIDLPPDIVALQSETPGILRALTADGQAHVLDCALPSCDVPDGPISYLTDWGALRSDGSLVFSPPRQLEPPGTARYVLASEHDLVVVDSLHVLHARVANDWWTESLSFGAQPVSIVSHTTSNAFTACILDAGGAVQCIARGADPPEFAAGPYRQLVGGFGAFCVQDLDGLVRCADGTTLEASVDAVIAAARYPSTDPQTGRWRSAEESGTSVCAASGSRIECVGPRYSSAVLDELPK